MIYFVLAATKKGIIGKGQQLPWSIADELANFQRITHLCTVLMGRKTFESIGHPLVDRENIILTRHPKTINIKKIMPNKQTSVRIITNPQLIIDKYANNPQHNVYVIGGNEVFNFFRSCCDGVFLSVIHKSYEGDVTFNLQWLDDFIAIPLWNHAEFTTTFYLRRP